MGLQCYSHYRNIAEGGSLMSRGTSAAAGIVVKDGVEEGVVQDGITDGFVGS